MNSQQLILDRIATAIAADERIVLIRDGQYVNTGTLRTLDADTLTQIAAVDYDFQQDNCHFTASPFNRSNPNRVASHWYGQPEFGSAPWVQRTIPALVDTVVTYLTTERNTP